MTNDEGREQGRNLPANAGALSSLDEIHLDDTNRVTPIEREGSQSNDAALGNGWSAMDHKALRRISVLLEKNTDPTWVNEDLYRLMYRADLYVMAYERIKSKPGNMTKGVDGTTIDGFSMKTIEGIISKMRDESFQFSRARRTYIPKKSGGKRPLGIGSPVDKVVQEVIRMILEAVYDSPKAPTFRDTSHGFRPGRSPHTALQEIKRTWHGATWMIEGDIKGCFDNIDHEILIGLLRKRIRDERFLNLIQKALSAGYMEFKVPVNSFVGTPQGSVLSPILANVYMHELDVYVETLRKKYEVRGEKKPSKEYKKLTERIYQLRKKLKTADDEAKDALLAKIDAEVQARLNVPVYKDDGSFVTVKYVRYADDWIVGVNGPKQLALKLRAEIGDFLRDTLKLTLSVEKTHIRHAKTEEAFFLGTRIQIGADGARKTMYVQHHAREESKILRRTTGWHPRLMAPTHKIIQRLAEKGLCYPNGKPKRNRSWTALDDDHIIAEYRAVMLGYSNYYSFVDNRSRFHRIAYIMRYSCVSTLASKHRLTLAQAFARFGNNPTVKVKTKTGERTVSLQIPTNFQKTNTFLVGEGYQGPETTLRVYWNRRSRSKLGLACVICGKEDDVQMHHIRHVRDMKGTKLVGFNRLMASINRKQIPVCKVCHDNIHHGRYDGKRLSEFHDPEGARR